MLPGLNGVLAAYDPGLVFVELGLLAPITVRGLADVPGAVRITAERRWISERGCDGEVFRRRQRARAGMLYMTVMQSSPVNDLLTAARMTDDLTGLAFSPIVVFDANGSGNRVAWAERAWLEGPPTEIELAPRPASLVYAFTLDGLEVVVGSLRRP